jgi:hypothetical protein
VEPPREMVDEIEEEDVIDENVLEVGYRRNSSIGSGNLQEIRRRRLSAGVPNY